MTFQYGWEPVFIQRILISFKAILETSLTFSYGSWVNVTPLGKTLQKFQIPAIHLIILVPDQPTRTHTSLYQIAALPLASRGVNQRGKKIIKNVGYKIKKKGGMEFLGRLDVSNPQA